MPRPPLTVIAGPTASGKSALAVRLAQAVGGEIISADSQQVYRRFDLGTAKPSPDELAAAPHHLISVVDPGEDFSAGRYQALADLAIAEVASRGKVPIVVGGTGLYLRVLLHGVVPAPPADPALRERLEALAHALGRSALHARLAEVDPQSAAVVQPNDLVRIIRALELWELTGKPASEQRAIHSFAEDRYPYRLFVLTPSREQLYQAIDRRAREMYAAGLVDEVRALVADGFRGAAAMGSVGYAQALEVVDGTLTLEAAIAKTAQQTRRYAKRQLTWFKKEKGARFVAPPYLEVS